MCRALNIAPCGRLMEWLRRHWHKHALVFVELLGDRHV
jgi:hypothetical protein